MSWRCADDGKGGCTAHAPTMRLEIEYDAKTKEPLRWSWLVDQGCSIGRNTCPALPTGVDASFGEQVCDMAYAYQVIIHPGVDYRRTLRRVRAAEKLRAKGKVTPGVTFVG